jgi:hypothetical protein
MPSTSLPSAARAHDPSGARGIGSGSTPPQPLAPFAGVLSYLVPGLGQIVQGRVGKGLLFLVCIYTLFFYGMYLGYGEVRIGSRTYRLASNVYLPDTVEDTPPHEGQTTSQLPPLLINLYNRPQFAGQFWVGVAAWPAIWQYMTFKKSEVHEKEHEIDRLYADADQANDQEEKTRKLQAAEVEERQLRDLNHPLLGDFQREPSASAINAVHNAGDKRLELAWVYTVIAGVLNIMVIYDAVAGPVFLASAADPDKKGQ